MTADPRLVEAVAEAIHRVRCCDSTDCNASHFYRDHATVAVEALVPLVRAQIAAEINEAADAHNQRISVMAGLPYDPERFDGMVAAGLRRAARIAEATTTAPTVCVCGAMPGAEHRCWMGHSGCIVHGHAEATS